MQPHHLYATCASLMSMVMRLSWYRVDANLGLHFGLRIQDSDTKNKAEIPLRDFSIIVHAKLCGTQTEFWGPSMRATKGDTITIIALTDFGLPSFSLAIGNSW